MKLELTTKEQEALHMAILTRIRTCEGLIQGWVSYPDQHSESLIKTYTEEIECLKSLEPKII